MPLPLGIFLIKHERIFHDWLLIKTVIKLGMAEIAAVQAKDFQSEICEPFIRTGVIIRNIKVVQRRVHRDFAVTIVRRISLFFIFIKIPSLPSFIKQ